MSETVFMPRSLQEFLNCISALNLLLALDLSDSAMSGQGGTTCKELALRDQESRSSGFLIVKLQKERTC